MAIDGLNGTKKVYPPGEDGAPGHKQVAQSTNRCDIRPMGDLISEYFALRQQSEGLREEAARFDGLFWRPDGDKAVRVSDGWELSIYRCEGQIEACVKRPDGTFSTYS